MLRRKRLPAHLEPARRAFLQVVASVEAAKAALTEAAPSTRFAGRPLADALAAFEAGLAEAADGMGAWRAPEIEAAWDECAAAVGRSRRLAERLRLEVEPPGGFEALIATLGDLMGPLEAFEDAEARFRALRR